MFFVDGTAILTTDDDVLRRYVWIGADDGAPASAVGGSYHVVRVIRMFVEFWDRTRLSEQEVLIGRRKANGAPLDGRHELDVPDYAADPVGAITPLTAHIRLANPRSPETQDSLILRRGINFSRGFDADGQLDQGLAFVSFPIPRPPGGRRRSRRLPRPRPCELTPRDDRGTSPAVNWATCGGSGRTWRCRRASPLAGPPSARRGPPASPRAPGRWNPGSSPRRWWRGAIVAMARGVRRAGSREVPPALLGSVAVLRS